MKDNSEKIRRRYNRTSYFYDFFNKGHEKKIFSKWKERYFFNLKGKILEVGVGTGASFPYYGKDSRVIGIDFSEKMLEKAKEKLKKIKNKNISLMKGDVENLSFRDNSFDYVVTSCVFCSVPNPIKGLKEIQRVLKPTGELIMLEHVLSENSFIAFFQHIFNPFTKFFIGSNINRNTKENILKAGLEIIQDKNLAFGDVIRLFKSKKIKGGKNGKR